MQLGKVNGLDLDSVWATFNFIFLLLLLVLHFSLGVLWPFSGVPLPHNDSTSSLAIALVTDAERSFDIVPVSQAYVCYHFCLLHTYSFMFRLDCPNDYSKRKPFYDDPSDKFLPSAIVVSSVDFLCDCIRGSDFRSQAQAKRETRRVVTARVVNKGGRCTAGEIDSYLDENEAWCSWGEEGSFSIQMSRSFIRKKRLLNNNKITLIWWNVSVEISFNFKN